MGRKFRYLAVLLACWLTAGTAAAETALPPKPVDEYTADDIAQALSWHWDAQANICHGYYQVSPRIKSKSAPRRIARAETDISADQTMLKAGEGTSVLTGNVIARQRGRVLKANKAYVVRCHKTGRLCEIRLVGPMLAEDPFVRFVSQYGEIDFKNNQSYLRDVYYRLHNPSDQIVQYDAWGRARKVVQKSDKILQLHDATYSTCQPGRSAWNIHAQKLELNDQTGRGVVHHGWLDFYGVPVLYTPYYNFPLRKQRKTGFLSPKFNRSSRQGYVFTLPFYWNMAPNYDATLTSQWLSFRGYKLNNTFRYITSKSQGKLKLDRMFSDDAFEAFKQRQLRLASNQGTTELRRLRDSNTSRSYIGYEHQTKFNDRWAFNTQLNYVTDDYYFQDFKQGLSGATQTQLLNQGELTYNSTHWDGLFRVQAYQTLHPVNQSHVNDKYSRLPEIRTDTSYKDLPKGLELEWRNQAVYFDHAQTFAQNDLFPTGLRFYSGPKLSWPRKSMSGFVTPALKLNGQAYRLFTPGTKDKTSLNLIPSASLDSGLYFVRRLPWTEYPYQQTLEPRVFYLYTPVISQLQQPNFDTTRPAFDFNQLFRMNRFTGVDRISNANQVSLGMTSRISDPYTGKDVVHGELGEILYLQKRKVCLDKPCDQVKGTSRAVSPLIGRVKYNITDNFSTSGNIAWQPRTNDVDNASWQLSYKGKRNRIIDIGYNFIDQDDDFPGAPAGDTRNDFSRLNAGASWPIYGNWHALGHIYYNLSHSWLQNYFYGVEYTGCCWSMRIMSSKNLIAVDNNNMPNYDRDIFFQIKFKGLAGFETKDPHYLLNKGLGGYTDVFGDE